jgi:hypothetical protein
MTQAKWLLQAAAGVALALVVPLTVLGAEDKERGVGDVVYVPTPQVVLDEMLRMAKIGPKDFIIDLGSGDGRMVITAAKKFGAQGFGVDLSDDLLREARANAKIEGVVDRAEFRKQNLFETDLKQATVLSTYLLPEMNEKLRPKILALPPGTRVVAHDYHMGEWKPDMQQTIPVPEKIVGTAGISYAYLWIVPAPVQGGWSVTFDAGKTARLDLDQTFQNVGGTITLDGRTLPLLGARLRGEDLSFQFRGEGQSVTSFSGKVNGNRLSGTISTDRSAQSLDGRRL